jgi:hypothetical protein
VLELTQQQAAILERLRASGFTFIAFPLYENYIGVKKGSCAALLAPLSGAGLKIFGEPCYLLNGHLTVRVQRDGREWFIWKTEKLEATPERLAELGRFESELAESLLPNS